LPTEEFHFQHHTNQPVTFYQPAHPPQTQLQKPVNHKPVPLSQPAFVHSPYGVPNQIVIDILRVRDPDMMPPLVEAIKKILGCNVTHGAKQTKAPRRMKLQSTTIQRLTLDTSLTAPEVINELQKHRLLHGLKDFCFGDRAIEFQQSGEYTHASAAEQEQGYRVNEFEHQFISELGLGSTVRMIVVEVLKTDTEVAVPSVQELAAKFQVHDSCCMALVSGGFCPCTPQGPADYRKFCADAHTKVTGCTQCNCRGYHEEHMLRDIPDVMQFVHEQTKWISNMGWRATQSCMIVTGHDFQPICAELLITGWCEPKTRTTSSTPMNCNFFHANLNVKARCQPKGQTYGNSSGPQHRHQQSGRGGHHDHEHGHYSNRQY